MGWANDLEKIAKKGGKDLGKLARAVKIEMFSGIVVSTRVAHPPSWKHPVKGYVGGRLRGNWQISEGSPKKGELNRKDKNGLTVNAEIRSGSSKNGKTYFMNNLPYAAKYEELDGMVVRNVARVKQNIKNMAKAIKG